RNQRQHRIFLISRIIGEVDSCKKLLEHPAGKDRYKNMRRLQIAIGSGDAAWPDGLELACSGFISAQPPKTKKSIFSGTARLINARAEAAFTIGLPDFNHRVRNGLFFPIGDAARKPKMLSLHLRSGNTADAIPFRRQPQMEERTNGLRRIGRG